MDQGQTAKSREVRRKINAIDDSARVLSTECLENLYKSAVFQRDDLVLAARDEHFTLLEQVQDAQEKVESVKKELDDHTNEPPTIW